LKDEYFGEYIKVAIGEKSGILKKPAPDTVYQAIRELNGNLECSVYVGDSEVDKKTAENAGMDCVMVSWGFRDKQKLQELGAKQIADTPLEVLNYLV
jgi:phosphoglycolate phosphatase